jgi:hypothetical protein
MSTKIGKYSVPNYKWLRLQSTEAEYAKRQSSQITPYEVEVEVSDLNHPLISTKLNGFKGLQIRRAAKSLVISGTCENGRVGGWRGPGFE